MSTQAIAILVFIAGCFIAFIAFLFWLASIHPII